MKARGGADIAKVLRKWTRKLLPEMLQGVTLNGKRRSRMYADISLWTDKDYPEVLEALAKLPDFGGDKKMADAYICGYRRGINEAVWQLYKNQDALEKAMPMNKE